MIDINAIINAAIADVVAVAVKTAVTEALSKLDTRITTLEDNPAQGTDMSLVHRITALEKSGGVPVDKAAMVEALDSQEWFWAKLSGYVDKAAEEAIEEAIEAHCADYDHDDYDRVVGEVDDVSLGDILTNGNVKDAVREIMEEATIRLRF